MFFKKEIGRFVHKRNPSAELFVVTIWLYFFTLLNLKKKIK